MGQFVVSTLVLVPIVHSNLNWIRLAQILKTVKHEFARL